MLTPAGGAAPMPGRWGSSPPPTPFRSLGFARWWESVRRLPT